MIADGPDSERRGLPRPVLVGGAVLLVAGGLVWALSGRGTAPEAPVGTSAAGVPTESAPPAPGPRSVVPDASEVQAARDRWAAENGMRAGNAAYAEGDLASADAQYREALAKDPGNAELRNNLAQVLIRQGRIDEAIAELDLAIQAEPGKWSYRFNRGRAWALKQQWPRAIADYLEASRQFPDDYATQYNLGLAYAKTNDHRSAAAAFEQSVRLAPGEPSFLVSLGTEYLALDRYADAKRVYEQYLSMAPDAADAAQVRAVLAKLPATPPPTQ